MYKYRDASHKKEKLMSQYSRDLGQLISRSQAERALRAAKLESDFASRTKSEFFANMSHELRTPLNAIIGFADLIRHFPPEERSKGEEYATYIANAGKHLLTIISDILDISKVESGTFRLNIEEYEIEDILHSSILLVRDRMHEKKQVLETRIPNNLPVIAMDSVRVKQILINLLSNAHKFTKEGGRILVMAEAHQGGVRIAIADTGIGMSAEQLAIAVTPFGQVQGAYSRAHEGTGLGLPIAIALAQQHGGNLHISSQPNVGTTAVLTLPAVPPEMQA